MIKLSEKDIAAIEVALNYEQADLPESNKELGEFLDVLINMQHYIVEGKIELPRYKVDVDGLITKSILHGNTIYYLLEGIPLKAKSISLDAKIFDLPTLHVILRSLLENYLIFDFIYVQPASESEIEFRNKNWRYAGYLSRKSFSASTKKTKKVKESDKIQIEELKEYLINSNALKRFSKQQRKQIIEKGNERLFCSWIDLMKKAKFNETVNLQLYRLLSSHAHTTAISIFNLKEMKLGYHPKSDLPRWVLFLTKLLICRLITELKNIIKTAEVKYNMIDRALTNRIEFYSKCATTNPNSNHLINF